MNRLEAIQEIRRGGSISNSFVGKEIVNGRLHTFSVEVWKDNLGKIKSVIVCDAMCNNYFIRLSPKQLLGYIKLHYTTRDLLE